MKAHIGVDAESGLTHAVVTTAANVSDVTQAHALLHGDETTVFGDAGYQGVGRRPYTASAPSTALSNGLSAALTDKHAIEGCSDEQ